MTPAIKALMYLVLCTALSACGSKDEAPEMTDQIFSAVKSKFNQKKNKVAGQKAAAGLSRAQVDASELPLLRLRIEDTGTLATAAAFAKNGNTDTYFMGTGQAVYLQNGILTGTRGLGHDLMSLEHSASNLRSAVGAGPKNRIYRHLNAEGQLIWTGVTCEFSAGEPTTLTQIGRNYSVLPITEYCEGESHQFSNKYMIDHRSGQIWQSIQWIGPVAGSIRIEVLKP